MNVLLEQIGRSHICVLRDNYVELIGVSRSLNVRDSYSTPLHVAAVKRKHLATVETLLKIPQQNNNVPNRYGETPLLLALKENVDEKIIDTLIENGCDCNEPCLRGVTPLHVAVLDNKINLLLKLIEKGASVNSVTDIGLTPLHVAVLTSNYEIVCLLLNHGANPTMVTDLQFTPLMIALSYPDIDIRICELLCSFDIHTGTRAANPVFCAVKAQHCYAEKLILAGADVSCICYGTPGTCLSEAISLNDKHLFDLIWPRFNKDTFNNERLVYFLAYFDDCWGFKGHDLVECLQLILGMKYGRLLITTYYEHRQHSFLENFFEDPDKYELSKEDRWEIIRALPMVFYEDILYVYKKFNFGKELTILLGSYELTSDSVEASRTSPNIYVDFLCLNTIKSRPYNLKDILLLLKYHTPNAELRSHFYNTFSCLSSRSDDKLETLYTLYGLCDNVLVNRTVPSLQELTRDKIRSRLFACNTRPYPAIDSLPLPRLFKDILFLKTPVYC